MKTITRRRLGSRRGNVLLEFALCATLLVTLFSGIFQFGFTFYRYNLLMNAVRGGARFASMQKISNQGNATVPQTFIDQVRNVVVFGSPAPIAGSSPIVPNLTTSQVNVSVTFDAKNVPRTVRVRLSSFSINALFRTFTVTNKPTLEFPFLGQYSPVGT